MESDGPRMTQVKTRDDQETFGEVATGKVVDHGRLCNLRRIDTLNYDAVFFSKQTRQALLVSVFLTAS